MNGRKHRAKPLSELRPRKDADLMGELRRAGDLQMAGFGKLVIVLRQGKVAALALISEDMPMPVIEYAGQPDEEQLSRARERERWARVRRERKKVLTE